MDLEQCLIDCLEGDVQLYISECVFGELEKLGRVYRLALNMIRGMKHNVLKCDHKGTYADDCIINRVKESKNYIVATTDANLRQRIKKIPIVPIVFFKGHKCVSERFAGGSLY
jgi:U3 small nucleolar RNA-associated protein 24